MTLTQIRPVETKLTRAAQVEQHEQGVWNEVVSQEHEYRRVTSRRPLPVNLVQQYADCAARHAVAKQLDSGEWYVEIKGFDGVWADAETLQDALDELREVVFEWSLIKILDKDRDLPVIEGFDLNSL